MKYPLKCILLIDDNPDDNYIHERVIKEYGFAHTVVAKESVEEALTYLNLKSFDDYVPPDLILLDINMPGMDGWEFLDNYQKLDEELQGAIIVLLTTLENEDDKKKAAEYSITSSFKTKPLTKVMMEEIVKQYFV